MHWKSLKCFRKKKTQSQGAHRLTHALALVLLALHAEELRAIALD